MKRVFIAAALAVLAAGEAPAGDIPDLRAEAAGKIKAFFGELKGELESGMKSGGPVAAIGACNTKAPDIAAAHSKDGWTVGRTSLKLRNPANTPDAWERAVLKEFAARKAAGEDPAGLVKAEVVAAPGGGKEFRFMKAIPTAEVCTKCHGTTVAPEVAARLDGLYPDDKARGYVPGDLRGAFTLRKAL